MEIGDWKATRDQTERMRSVVIREAERRLERRFDLEDERDLEGWTLIPYLL